MEIPWQMTNFAAWIEIPWPKENYGPEILVISFVTCTMLQNSFSG